MSMSTITTTTTTTDDDENDNDGGGGSSNHTSSSSSDTTTSDTNSNAFVVTPLEHAASLPSIAEKLHHGEKKEKLPLLPKKGQENGTTKKVVPFENNRKTVRRRHHHHHHHHHSRVISSVTTASCSPHTSIRAVGTATTTATTGTTKGTTADTETTPNRRNSTLGFFTTTNESSAAFQPPPPNNFSPTPTPLLQNMMRSHKNRNPYLDYRVLATIGKGSIGSVEKVVRRHHRHMVHHSSFVGDDENSKGSSAKNKKKSKKRGSIWNVILSGAFFGNCCTPPPNNHPKDNHSCFTLFGFGVCPKLLSSDRSNRHRDAFQSSSVQSSADDYPSSVVSESSAFSAPSTPTMPHYDERRRRFFVKPSEDNLNLNSNSCHGELPGSGGDSSSSSHNHQCCDGGGMMTSHSAHHLSLTTHHRYYEHPLRKYALKSIRLDRCKEDNGHADRAELRNEIAILRSLDHPNIVHVIETYEFRNNIHMVLELCENGDLYVYDPYSENEAREIVRQLVGAVSYMHHRGIVHRDLKYENVMFTDRSRSKLEIKLIDFGLSIKYGKSKGKLDMSAKMTDFVGTIYTMAPEVIRENYTFKCDLWSVGVMAYMLLSSQIPFCGKSIKEVAKKIMVTDPSFTGRKWSKISALAKDFVKSLLVRDVNARPDADRALKHPWLVGRKRRVAMNRRGTLHRRHSSEMNFGSALSSLNSYMARPLDYEICTSIENFSTYSWIHRLALMVIAYRYTGGEITYLRRIFYSYDVDDNGTVEAEELRNAFVLHDKYSTDEIDQIFLAMDMSGSGKISWTEFLAATIETKGVISQEEFCSAFDHLDFDNNGYISTSDLRAIIGRDLPQNIIDQIIDESDIIGDHKIWKDEFLALADESTAALVNLDQKENKQVRVYLKRSKSADDFDLVKARSDNIMGSDQFCIEKAKSVRKTKHF